MSFSARLQKLQARLKELKIDGFIIEDLINLYYLTGIQLSAGKIFVTPSLAYLIVDGRYFETCRKKSPIPAVLATDNAFSDIVKNSPDCHLIGFDSETTTYSSFQELQKRFPQLIAVPNIVKQLRMIKENDEIALLKEAAALGSEGFDYVLSILQEGITEEDVALELEIFWKRKGGKKVAFEPIIAFGENGSMPHYRAGNVKLKKGDSVLIDIGVNYKNYHSDMTRVVYFGEPDKRLLKLHAILQRAQQAALDLCRPGTLIGHLDAAARDIIKAEGYGDQFTHSLGHGVGLEIHEEPVLRNKLPHQNMELKSGMVITIEPGIYVEGLGGIRIEDTVVITPEGHENLTLRTKNPVEIAI